MFGNAVQHKPTLRGMITGAPPPDTATAALGAGTSRRLPLRVYCYLVVISYNRVVPPHYMRGPGYKSPTLLLLTYPHVIQLRVLT